MTTHNFTIRATDAEGLTFDQADTITVVIDYDAAADALFAAMSVAPDDTRKGHINTLIASLKTAGVWTKTDVLYLLAAHDSQAARLNWKNPATFLAAGTVAPTFTTDRGYTGNGTTQYLDSGFNPSTAGGVYTQNSSHMAVWSGTDVNSSGVDVGSNYSRINSRSASNAPTRHNALTTNTIQVVASSIGWTCVSRNNSADYEVVRDLGTPSTVTQTSSALGNFPFYICANAVTLTTSSLWSTRRIQAVHWGSALTDTERDAYYNALLTYMTAVGAV